MRRTQHKVYIPVNTNKHRYKVTIRPDTSRMGIGYFKKVGGMEWVCKKLSMIYINVTAPLSAINKDLTDGQKVKIH